MKSCDAVKYLS